MPDGTLTEKAAWEALRQVKFPGFSRDIVSFGIVRGLKVHGDIVSARLEMTSDRPGLMDQVKAEAEKCLRALPGAGRVLIETKVTPSAAATVRPAAAAQAGILPQVRHAIAVASGKGGVGKSTVAVNLAVALAREGWTVGLLDADIYGPSVPLMMGALGERPSAAGGGLKPIERHGLGMMSIGFFLDKDDALVWRGPMVMKAVTQLLEDVEWGARDYLVIDLPPGTGDAQLTISQSVRLSGAIIVTTPQDVALVDAIKGVTMFRKVDVPILGLVENMSYFICPHCGTRSEIFSHGGAEREAGRLNVPFLGEIPIHPGIRAGGDMGLPVVVSDPGAAQSRAFSRLAKVVVTALDGDEARPGSARPEGVMGRMRKKLGLS